MSKASVKLGGVTLAANNAIAWRFQTGTAPYMTQFTVHDSDWPKLRKKKGQPLTLEITDARGSRRKIQEVTILQEAPSSSPNRTSFIVADRRWKWNRSLVVRSYNVPKKTGDRSAKYDTPYPGTVTVDVYRFKEYSLNDGKRWSAKEVLEDVLKEVEDGNYSIASFPIEGGGEEGQFSIQNLILADSFDLALSRVLQYIPGAEIYIREDGKIEVFDGADLEASKSLYDSLPTSSWDGESAVMVDRSSIRPKEIVVYYQKELELELHAGDYSLASLSFDDTDPYMENVVQTTDPETTYQDILAPDVDITVPAGTWIDIDTWTNAMDQNKSTASCPWFFDTFRLHWINDSMIAVLGGSPDQDDVRYGLVSARVQSLQQHFRRTYRINRDYADKIAGLVPFRAKVLDPVSGVRVPAQVWSQVCVISSNKMAIVRREAWEDYKYMYNVNNFSDPLWEVNAGVYFTEYYPVTPANISIVNDDAGIIHIDYQSDPWGLTKSIVPSNVVEDFVQGPTGNVPASLACSRDLEMQHPGHAAVAMGTGFKFASYPRACGINLSPVHSCIVIMSAIPGAPNSKKRLYSVKVTAEEVSKIYRAEFGIKNGNGPPLEVFISPEEVTARFAIKENTVAIESAKKVFGLVSEEETKKKPSSGKGDPTADEDEIPGYVLSNRETELKEHALAVAAEMYAAYADNIQGSISTVLPRGDIKLRGNINSATIRVSPYPSAKVSASWEFPGQQRPISRFSLLPTETRNYVLGVVRLDGSTG